MVFEDLLCSKRISVANQSKQWHQANHDLQPALCAGKRVPVCPEYQSPIVFRLIPILLWSLDWKPLKSAFKFTSDVCSSPDSVMVLSRCSTVCISRSTSCISRALSVLSCWISLLSWTICKKKRKFWILYWNAILDDLRAVTRDGKEKWRSKSGFAKMQSTNASTDFVRGFSPHLNECPWVA